MAKLQFQSNPSHTIGVELELAVVDSSSGALATGAEQILAAIDSQFAGAIKPELMQCVVEVNSDVYSSVSQARDDLAGKLYHVQQAAEKLGLSLFWAATHPFSRWEDQVVTKTDRYLDLVELLQEMARRLITNGLHVHVGVDSGDKAVMICDRIMQHLPILLALSASSPYWQDR